MHNVKCINNLTDIEILEIILENCDLANRKPFRHTDHSRPKIVDDALENAYHMLPEGREKRALCYVIAHSTAEFHFGGKDAVGPAIRKGMELLKKERIKTKADNIETGLYPITA